MKRRRTRRLLCLIVAMLGLSLGTASFAQAQPADLLAFFERQGCAIGPATRNAAIAAGFTPEAIDTLAVAARGNTKTVTTGGWLVLPADLCTIMPPHIDHVLKLGDADVAKAFSAPDAYAKEGDAGCFLNPDVIKRDVREARGWDDTKAYIEYLRLLGASMISGELVFNTDDRLHTPAGIQLITGPCAAVPRIAELKRDHELLIRHFDALIRASGAALACKPGESPMAFGLPDILKTVSGGENTNAWLGMELMIIALGSGWYEGTSMTEKGTPRPPLCHYE